MNRLPEILSRLCKVALVKSCLKMESEILWETEPVRGWKCCSHDKRMNAKHGMARACMHGNVADCRAPNCLSREAAFNICQLQEMFFYL